MKTYFLLIFIFIEFWNFSQKINFTEKELKWISEHPVVEFGYEPNWPPYDIFENGEYTGICSEYFKIISKKTGIHFEPKKDMTWSKSLEGLKTGKILMLSSVGKTPEREKYLIFSDIYINIHMVVVTKINQKKFSHLKDFEGKTISLPKDYFQEELIMRDFPKIKILRRKNIEACLKDVSEGRSLATVESIGSVSYFINNKGFSDLKIAFYTHYHDNGVGFAFPKEQKTLKNIVNKALRSISFKQRDKIQTHWINVKYENLQSNKKLYSYLILSISIIIIGFTIFYLWNKSLRKKINKITEIERELFASFEQIKRQDGDKTILLQEIHHRVKNNLQIIISMLRLQANSQQNSEVKAAFDDAIDRINTISLIHEHIYKSPNLTEFSLDSYIESLAKELKHIFVSDKNVQFHIETNHVNLDIKPIIPLALILNELLTNSFKYGLKSIIDAEINILISIENGSLHLKYSDNGKWFENEYSANFGTYLIEIFTEQLDGTYQRIEGSSANYHFIFNGY